MSWKEALAGILSESVGGETTLGVNGSVVMRETGR